jgi:iron-sulfur cluster assembly accessory protein
LGRAEKPARRGRVLHEATARSAGRAPRADVQERNQEDGSAMLTLTRMATEKVQDFIQEHGVDGPVGLRVAVLPGGCSGFQYGLNIEDGPEDDDEVLDVAGVRVFVDPFSAQYLEGVEIDYVSSMMGQGFTFRNPNASGGCGCGSSFTV